jgi:benzoyl-CoA reductase/2-hydroxyglutaryl-CoA dehydratase subunit BcrC/BadD/HgdB
MKHAYAEILRNATAGLPAPAGDGSAAAAERGRAASPLRTSAPFYAALGEGPAGAVARRGPRPVVATLCNAVPDEIIMACGALPVRLCCAEQACARAGEQVGPADLCPLVKSLLGQSLQPFWNEIHLLAIPATCDGKVQLHQHLSHRIDTHLIDLPRGNDYLENGDVWAGAFAAFRRRLMDRLRVRCTRADLLRACQATNRRTRVYRRLRALRAARPDAIGAGDYFAMTTASFYMEADAWTAAAEALLVEAGERPAAARPPRKRILLVGSPVIFPGFKVLDLLEQAGCCVAADALCSAYGRLFDPVVVDEDTEDGILRALSLKYVAASLCPCYLSFQKFMDHILETVREFRLDGVVYHTLRLCQVAEMQVGPVRKVLKEHAVPFLALKTDLGEEDAGQLKTRMEAFAEML